MPFSSNRLHSLETALSTERLNSWEGLVSHPRLAIWRARAGIRLPANREAAIRLHQWNMALSMSFMASLQIFELVLRNKIHDALRGHVGRDDWWIPSGTNLLPPGEAQLSDAMGKLGRTGKPLTPGRVVSELPLGFWVSLTGPGYDNPRKPSLNYWRTSLSDVFRQGSLPAPKRAEVNVELNAIRLLRNNVAHQEPIVAKDLGAEFQTLLLNTKRLCFDTAEWLQETSLIPGLLGPDWLQALQAAGRLIGSR